MKTGASLSEVNPLSKSLLLVKCFFKYVTADVDRNLASNYLGISTGIKISFRLRNGRVNGGL